MLYLEDYLEMIEHLPQELRDRLTDMRELDLQVHNELDSLEEQSKQFFSNAKKQKQEQRDSEFLKLKQDYYKTLEGSDEKINIATQVYELVERYLKRLDSELQKFKIELEADNPGITEILEKRSLELDSHPSNSVNQNHGRKRSALNSVNNLNNSHRDLGTLNNYSSNHSQNYNRSDSISNAQNSHLNSSLNSSLHPGLSPFDTSLNMNNQNVSNSNLSSLSCHNPSIAACASQAIAATHQLQGRRTASFKSTYEALNSGLQNMNDFNMSYRESSGLNSNSSNSSLTNPSATSFSSSQFNNEGYYPRMNKRIRTASHLNNDMTDTSEFNYTDTNEKRYCTCNEYSYGDMVACDNGDCPFEWFHYGCVGITHPPRGRWYCNTCIEMKKKMGKKEKV